MIARDTSLTGFLVEVFREVAKERAEETAAQMARLFVRAKTEWEIGPLETMFEGNVMVTRAVVTMRVAP